MPRHRKALEALNSLFVTSRELISLSVVNLYRNQFGSKLFDSKIICVCAHQNRRDQGIGRIKAIPLRFYRLCRKARVPLAKNRLQTKRPP